MHIGFIGLGRMGRPMAANLAAAGHDLVIWNRTRAKAEAFAASRGDGINRVAVVDRPADAARGADIVFTMLADDDAVRRTYLGDDGVFAGLDADGVAIDMSTISPALARTLHAAAHNVGAAFLEVPVSGSVAAAEAGTLTLMAAGEEAAVERVRVALEVLGRPLIYLGSGGAGAAMKLAVNAVIHSLNEAIAEALALAEAAGIARETAYRVLEESAVAAPMVAYRKPQYLEPDDAPVSFTLELAHKDVRLALELAQQLGASMPQAEVNRRVLEAAIAAGYGEHDMAAVARYLRNPGNREGKS